MVKYKGNILLLLILISLFSYARLDIPVHCLSNQIIGDWTFQISTNVFTPSLTDQQTTCGHGFPDKIAKTEGDYTIPDGTQVVLTLSNSFTVLQNNVQVGNYTLVYDEGMIIYYNNSVITVYFYYYPDSSSQTGYSSICSKTMMGWFIPDLNNKMSNWSCASGFINSSTNSNSKANLNGNSQSNANNDNKKSIFDNDDDSTTNFIQTKVSTSTDSKGQSKLKKDTVSTTSLLQLDERWGSKYESQNKLIEEVNSSNQLWKAGVSNFFQGMTLMQVYEKVSKNKKMNLQNKSKFLDTMKLQKSSSEASSKNTFQFLQKNMTTKKTKTNSKTQRKTLDTTRDADSQNEINYSTVTKYLNTDINDIDASTLPLNWDWRNVGGISYVPQPRVQGDCGSCYVFASLSSLESRLRIKTNNNDKTEFSRQFVLSCGIYTEGCDGGYPILLGKFLNEFEMINDACMPYTQQTGECSNYCDFTKNPKKYFVSSYKYIGGYYGNSSEEEMVKELRARGPILGNISVPGSFSYYKSGIYNSSGKTTKNSGSLSESTMFSNGDLWEKVDHSTLIIGYGEENGVKYWIGMNTWGSDWGENGYYRILRGENESYIESMADVLDIGFSNR